MFGIQGWVDPVDGGRITSGTGQRKAFRTQNGNKSSSLHHGIDWAKGLNAPIKAAFGGKVVQAGWINGYGNMVIVRAPDGTYAQYSHLNDFNVAVGETLTAGQQLGRMGQTGNSTGPHLDLIIARNGHSLDVNGKPHTRTKPWLQDGGGTAASYKPADPKNRAVVQTEAAPTPSAVKLPDSSGLVALAQQLSSLAQAAGGETSTPLVPTPALPQDETTAGVDLLTDPVQAVEDFTIMPSRRARAATVDVALPQEDPSDIFDADAAHRNWLAALQQSIETANYGDAQEEALHNMFTRDKEPPPNYGTIPDGISSYIDSLIKKV